MFTITTSADGTLTREGARVLRSHGVNVTGSTKITSAQALARKAGLTCEFVSATTGAVVKPRKVQHQAAKRASVERPKSTGFVREQIRASKARKQALEMLTDLSV